MAGLSRRGYGVAPWHAKLAGPYFHSRPLTGVTRTMARATAAYGAHTSDSCGGLTCLKGEKEREREGECV